MAAGTSRTAGATSALAGYQRLDQRLPATPVFGLVELLAPGFQGTQFLARVAPRGPAAQQRVEGEGQGRGHADGGGQDEQGLGHEECRKR